MPVVKFIPLLSPLSYPLIKTDFQLLKSHLSFLYSRIRWWKKVSNQNFWCVYSEIGIGSRYQVGREIINAWSLKYYGTSNRRKRVASVSNTKAMREMKNSRKSALEVGEFQWARIEMFSSSSSNIRHDNFPRYRLVVSVIMTHIFHAPRVAKIYDHSFQHAFLDDSACHANDTRIRVNPLVCHPSPWLQFNLVQPLHSKLYETV